MEHNQEDTVACPVCDERMKFLTVRKCDPYEETLAFQCRRCGVSTTKT
jgi:C4-type Zn-finger protein